MLTIGNSSPGSVNVLHPQVRRRRLLSDGFWDWLAFNVSTPSAFEAIYVIVLKDVVTRGCEDDLSELHAVYSSLVDLTLVRSTVDSLVNLEDSRSTRHDMMDRGKGLIADDIGFGSGYPQNHVYGSNLIKQDPLLHPIIFSVHCVGSQTLGKCIT